MGSKRNRVRHQAQAATAFSEQRFRPNPITVALLASLGSMPAWGVDTTNINRYVPAGSDPSLNGTSIQTNGTVTTVNTTTVRGSTGFNSFGDFKLVAGDTVNLNLPGGTENLVNLVHNSRAEINGTLNAFKNGSIGGHVIFADPLGVVVGSSGVLNVGSLTITTPSTADMATLHGIATGTGSDKDAAESVEKLKNGGYFSGTGTVEIKDLGQGQRRRLHQPVCRQCHHRQERPARSRHCGGCGFPQHRERAGPAPGHRCDRRRRHGEDRGHQ